MCPLTKTDLTKPSLVNNAGGILPKAYWALASEVDMTAFPAIAADPSSFGDFVTISGPVAFLTDGKFYEGYCIPEKGSLVGTSQGERGGMSTSNIATIVRPGNEADSLGFIERMKNEDLIVIVTDMEGKYRLLGDDKIAANIESHEITTGTAQGDLKGVTMTIKAGPKIAPVYTGAIVTTPAA